jgi:uncharacterized membrane protein YphA (DoxX/SURF4 family)
MRSIVVGGVRTRTRDSRNWLNIGLWTAQILLAVAFGMAGVMKVATPIAELGVKMAWVTVVPAGLVRFIGASEFLGAVGVLLPAATRIKPGLTALAATGLLLVMVLAAGFHVSRGEWQMLPPSLILGALAAFVAWGRFKASPITSL